MTKSRGVGRGFGGGRPTDYRPEFNAQVTGLCMLGAKDEEIADILGVSTVTLWSWTKQFPKFLNALNQGRHVADTKVTRSLYRKALAGNVTACIFWLKNRRPQEWRDVQEHMHHGMTLEQLVCGVQSAAENQAPVEESATESENSGGLVQ